jgi:hypothetical protein
MLWNLQILRMEVKRSFKWLILTQEKYYADLLAKVGMCHFTTFPTPLSLTNKFSLIDGSPLGSKIADVTVGLLVCCNNWHGHVLIYHSLWTKTVNIFMPLLPLIGELLREFWEMSKVHLNLSLHLEDHPLLFRCRLGRMSLMTWVLLESSLFFGCRFDILECQETKYKALTNATTELIG